MIYTYPLRGYGRMIADEKRTAGYLEALRGAVNPDSVVLDIGTGTGILAMMACQCGAARVYAIDPSDLIHLARELAAANGYADRIHFIQGISTQITLPEPVDVIVSDLHGALPFFQQLIPSIADARQRFLAPGGRLIPQEDTLWAAVVELPKLYGEITAPWDENVYGLDLRPARPWAVNDSCSATVKPEQLLAPAQCWWTLDFYTMAKPNAQAELTWTITRTGTAHGIVIWFDALLAPGVSFSNRPGEEHVHGRAFLPWPDPVILGAGDVVSVDLTADLVGNDYLWRWDTRVLDQGQPGRLKAEFCQSTLLNSILSPAKLQRLASTHVPIMTEDGKIDGLILELMDGRHSLNEIARQLAARFPARFAGEPEALSRVGELSLKYGRPLDNKYLKDA